jgi:hypothetical protein
MVKIVLEGSRVLTGFVFSAEPQIDKQHDGEPESALHGHRRRMHRLRSSDSISRQVSERILAAFHFTNVFRRLLIEGKDRRTPISRRRRECGVKRLGNGDASICIAVTLAT